MGRYRRQAAPIRLCCCRAERNGLSTGVPAPSFERMALFDASIDVHARSIPHGLQPAAAVSKVAAAVTAMPGAGRVSVIWRDDPDASLPFVHIRQGSEAFRLDEAACLRLAALVEAEVRRVLFPALVAVGR